MWSKKRKQADFAAEIEAHINLEAERLRQEGLDEADALAAARRKFGNVFQAEERFYFSQRTMLIEQLRNDLRYAIRVIRHAPMFAATVVVTLALGIGATAAIFAVADAALIRPLPFPDANRLVLLYERWQGDLDSFAPADFLDFQRQSKSFADLAAYRQDPTSAVRAGPSVYAARSSLRTSSRFSAFPRNLAERSILESTRRAMREWRFSRTRFGNAGTRDQRR
jgi:hypothetical protein